MSAKTKHLDTVAETLRQLVLLQELEFVRSEQEATNDDAGARTTAAEILRHQSRLPESCARSFRQLLGRDSVVVVPLHHGACSACGVTLPTSQAEEVRAAVRLLQCPNCGRFLHHVSHVPEAHRRAALPKGARWWPCRFSSSSLMIPRLSSASLGGALSELIERMAGDGVVEDPSRVLKLALDRERMASTSLEGGLALPHVRGIEGGGMVFSLGLSPRGLRSDEGSDQLIHIVVFTAVPTAASGLYLRLVRELLQPLRDRRVKKRLLESPTEAAVWRVLSSLAGEASSSSGRSPSKQSADGWRMPGS